jgi:hypothetical protein
MQLLSLEIRALDCPVQVIRRGMRLPENTTGSMGMSQDEFHGSSRAAVRGRKNPFFKGFVMGYIILPYSTAGAIHAKGKM